MARPAEGPASFFEMWGGLIYSGRPMREASIVLFFKFLLARQYIGDHKLYISSQNARFVILF